MSKAWPCCVFAPSLDTLLFWGVFCIYMCFTMFHFSLERLPFLCFLESYAVAKQRFIVSPIAMNLFELNCFTNCRVKVLTLRHVCAFPGKNTCCVFSICYNIYSILSKKRCSLFHQLPCQSVNLAPCLRLPWKEYLLRVFYML